MINPELYLIKPLLNKEYYNKYKEYIDFSYLESYHREITFLYRTLQRLHDEHAGNLSIDEFAVAFYAFYPDADKTLYGKLLNDLQAAEIGEDIARYSLDQIIAKKRALKVSEIAFQVAQGFKEPEELDRFFAAKDDHQPVGELPLTTITDDLEELLHNVHAEQGYRWRLDCLNKALGSLRRGDFGFIFARPETGKTTFLASESTAFLTSETAGRVAWFNNEEQGNKVMLRVYQAYFGVTLDQLFSNPKRYKNEFQERTGNRFQLYDSSTISRTDVETIVARTKPDIVIYDQIDKIKGFSADRPDLQLGAIYQWARELAKNSHAAIGVCQADGSAEGVRYLTMEHVSNAKTAKQAEADWILGIGKSHDDGLEYARFLNICKNKLMGDKDSIPDLRHGRFEVLIEPNIARYKDVIKFD